MERVFYFVVNGVTGAVFGLAFGLVTMLFAGVSVSDSNWHRELIERGLAQYCPVDGEWAWKGECKK